MTTLRSNHLSAKGGDRCMSKGEGEWEKGPMADYRRWLTHHHRFQDAKHYGVPLTTVSSIGEKKRALVPKKE